MPSGTWQDHVPSGTWRGQLAATSACADLKVGATQEAERCSALHRRAMAVSGFGSPMVRSE
jgi:hypothetical protein